MASFCSVRYVARRPLTFSGWASFFFISLVAENALQSRLTRTRSAAAGENASKKQQKRLHDLKARQLRRPAVDSIALLVIQQLFMAERNGSQNAGQRGCE